MFGKFNPGQRTETIHLRSTPEERNRISLAALKTRRTMTNFVLSATLSAADKVLAGLGEIDPVESVVEPLPPAPDQLDGGSAKVVSLSTGLTSNLTQLTKHAEQIGGVLTGLTTDQGPLKKLSAATLAIGLAAKSGQLKGAQATDLVDALADPARQLNELARRLNEGQQVDPRDWHAPISGISNILLAA